jgi:preprotein translocase subunit SecG
MQQLIFLVHVLAAVCLVALVLLQHGKGADAGAAFGSGASQTMFGSIGAMPFLTKVTAGLATLFFVTSLGLGYLVAKQKPVQNVIPAAPVGNVIPAPIVPTEVNKIPVEPATKLPLLPAQLSK